MQNENMKSMQITISIVAKISYQVFDMMSKFDYNKMTAPITLSDMADAVVVIRDSCNKLLKMIEEEKKNISVARA